MSQQRAVQGHRHRVRPLTENEERRLVELDHARRDALEAFDSYVYELYMAGASQAGIGRVMGVGQNAIARRVAYRRERMERNDGDPGYDRPQGTRS